MTELPSPEKKLAPFTIHDVTYKTVSSVPIEATILIPKAVKPRKHPLLVRFHGGSLITGARMYMPFFHAWVIQFALKHNAVIVVPDYRLMPEAAGLDVLDDVKDFWAWTRETLPSALESLAPGVEIDLGSIAVMGESAGGYLAVQSALLFPRKGFKAVIASYPILDVASRFFTEAYEKPMIGFPQISSTIIDEHLAAMKPGAVVATDPADPPARFPLATAAVQYGKYLEWLGSDERLQPFKNLEKFEGELPFMFMFHGREDTAVPVEGMEKWEQLLTKIRKDGKWKVTYQDGEHGFDAVANLETPWLKEGLTEVEKHFP